MKTALNGALQYVDGAWQWRTGEYEPRVRSLKLRGLAPNFRCIYMASVGTTLVEIPRDWTQARYWPARRVDDDARAAISKLLAGRALDMIYAQGTAEALKDHELKRPGWLVFIAQWDDVMNEVVGAEWDKADEVAILGKAQSLKE